MSQFIQLTIKSSKIESKPLHLKSSLTSKLPNQTSLR